MLKTGIGMSKGPVYIFLILMAFSSVEKCFPAWLEIVIAVLHYGGFICKQSLED